MIHLIVTDKKTLRQQSNKVEDIKEGLKLADDLIHTATNKKGLGLAAIQIGEPARVCVVFDQMTNKWLKFINPKIVGSQGTIYHYEGCLSIPNIRLLVERSQSVQVTSDQLGKEAIQFDGLIAATIQHEIDHMNGILITDREYKKSPYKRNDEISITNGRDTKNIKFKHLFKHPDWVIASTDELLQNESLKEA